MKTKINKLANKMASQQTEKQNNNVKKTRKKESMTNNNANTTTETLNTLIVRGINKLVGRTEWTGTMTDLNKDLTRVLGSSYRSIRPGSPSALRVAVNRVVSKLRNTKTSVKFYRDNGHSRTRMVSFSK